MSRLTTSWWQAATRLGTPEQETLRVATVPPRRAYPNPYLALLANHLAVLGIETIDLDVVDRHAPDVPFDVLHVHWPEYLLTDRVRSALKLARLERAARACKRRGGAVVWTLHNLRPHERRPWAQTAWSTTGRLADAVVSLSQHALDALEGRGGLSAETRRIVIGHGELREVHGPAVPREEARRTLGLDADDRVLLTLGQVRGYKGVPDLIQAVRNVDDPRLRLIVTGRVMTPGLASELSRAAAGDNRVQIVDAFLDDRALTTHLGAADLAVLPYRRVTHSGSAILALSYDVPVLSNPVGALPEWQSQLGRQWLHLSDGAITSHTVRTALEQAMALRGQRWPVPDSQRWPSIAQSVGTLYRQLLAR